MNSGKVPYGFSEVAGIVLGHEGVDTSIRYNNVQPHAHIPCWFGALKWNVFSREGEYAKGMYRKGRGLITGQAGGCVRDETGSV